MNFRPHSTEEIGLDITPLIDVVFLLASKETVETKVDSINITIDSQSNIYINDKELVNSQLTTIKQGIYEAMRGLEDVPVIISADAETPHQTVVRAMDAARQLNLLRIIFATRISEDEAP